MDAQGNLSQSVVIDEPGTWCLCEDVIFNPVEPGTPAIQILSNNVLLDLKENTLRQANKDVSDTYGVQIGEGYNYTDPNAVLQNITITNGSITNFSAIGVFCYNGSFDGPVEEGFEQLSFKSLNFSDLNILECGSSASFDFGSGIDLDSADPIPAGYVAPGQPVAYSGLIINQCNVNRCIGTSAINVYTFDNVILEDTQANNLTFEEAPFGITAAYLMNGRNLQMTRCQGNGTANASEERSSSTAPAIISSSINMYFKDCQFNDTFGENDFLVGCQFNLIQNTVFENCQFNNTRGGRGTTLVNGYHTSDFELQPTQANGIKLINCQFNGAYIDPTNEETNAFIAGCFLITTRNLVIEDCQACNIISQAPGHEARGFFVAVNPTDPLPVVGNVHNVTFKRCVASDILCQSTNAAGGFFVGYSDGTRNGEQSKFTNMVIEDCIAQRISSYSLEGRCYGIMAGTGSALNGQQFGNGRNLYVNNCRVSDVRSIGELVSPLSAGILVSSTFNPVLKNNSVSDCDRGVLFTGSDLITPDTLFQLAETFTGATVFTPVPVDLTSIPSPTPLQLFINQTRPTPAVVISPSTTSIDLDRNYLFSQTDLNTLGWQLGDAILYDNNGGTDIGGLVDDQIYYLIVYVPGFAENGVVINNSVDNCSVSGYQDDLTPNTTSAWVNNFAFNNGTPADELANYDINWSGTAPVYAGDLANYPTGDSKTYNISLIP